jgi:chemotaxis protein CheZ
MAAATARASRADNPGNGSAGADKDVAQQVKALSTETDVQTIVRELASVADYIAHMKKEISALRPNELSRERIPLANDELGTVIQATASATHTIMAAAEEILGAGELSDKDYRSLVETRILAIFEACSFQDITGQRISKVLEALGHLEKRLARFAEAVKVRDSADGPDPEEALRQARREVLLLHGPQNAADAIKQDDIDALFD